MRNTNKAVIIAMATVVAASVFNPTAASAQRLTGFFSSDFFMPMVRGGRISDYTVEIHAEKGLHRIDTFASAPESFGLVQKRFLSQNAQCWASSVGLPRSH